MWRRATRIVLRLHFWLCSVSSPAIKVFLVHPRSLKKRITRTKLGLRLSIHLAMLNSCQIRRMLDLRLFLNPNTQRTKIA